MSRMHTHAHVYSRLLSICPLRRACSKDACPCQLSWDRRWRESLAGASRVEIPTLRAPSAQVPRRSCWTLEGSFDSRKQIDLEGLQSKHETKDRLKTTVQRPLGCFTMFHGVFPKARICCEAKDSPKMPATRPWGRLATGGDSEAALLEGDTE